MANLVVNAGLDIITNRLKGAGTEPNAVAWGEGVGTTAAADTTLFVEGPEDRVAGTSTREQTTVANDTYQVIGTISAESPGQHITNAGLFDTTTKPGGNLLTKGDFGTINLGLNDSIQFTIKVVFS